MRVIVIWVSPAAMVFSSRVRWCLKGVSPGLAASQYAKGFDVREGLERSCLRPASLPVRLSLREYKCRSEAWIKYRRGT
jgi:hypothetical protein